MLRKLVLNRPLPSHHPYLLKRRLTIDPNQLTYYQVDSQPKASCRKVRTIFIFDKDKYVGDWVYNLKSGQICIVRELEDYHKNGIGTKVLNHILADLKKNGVTKCWGVTQIDPYQGDFSGPFFLAKKFGALQSTPAHPNVTGDGFSLEIGDDKEYPRLNPINIMPEITYLEMDLHQYYIPDKVENVPNYFHQGLRLIDEENKKRRAEMEEHWKKTMIDAESPYQK